MTANQYGGAELTQYISLGAQSSSSAPYTLQLTTPANYFGFWWSAGDAQNGISFYSNGTLLARFGTQDILTLLGNTTVTSVDQQVYQTGFYFGNPNYDPKQNTAEPYAYVNIFANGATFDQIVFDNSNTTGTGFESDNHSVYFSSTPLAPAGSSVFVKEIPATVPEPSAALLSAGAGLALLWARTRRRA